MFSKFLKSGLFVGAVFVSSVCANPARAAEPVLLKESGNWSAYTLQEGGQKICYMLSAPVNDQGDYKSRGEIYAIITHRPAQNTRDVFSYITGYTYKPGSSAKATVDGKAYDLFTQDDTAWTPDAAADMKLVAAIRKGSKFIVQGTSSRGTLTTDTFSLKGSGDAYAAISKACGVKL